MSQTYYSRPQDTESDFQCRHIFTDGHRCGSPCLRHEELCYYHHTTRRPVEDPAARKARLGTFVFPGSSELSDRSGIQLAIAQVLERVASNDLDPRRAGLLLYGLQTAALILHRPSPKADAPIFVTEMTEDPTLGPLAPRATIEELEYKSPTTRLLDELLHEGDFASENTVLPTVQAVAASIKEPARKEPAGKSVILSQDPCKNDVILSEDGRALCARRSRRTPKVPISPIPPTPFSPKTRSFLFPVSCFLFPVSYFLLPTSCSARCTTSSPNPSSHSISVSRRNHVSCRFA